MSRNKIVQLFILLSTFSSLNGLAQNKSANSAEGGLRGKVVESINSSPLEFATISIYSQKDSSLITGNITSPSGEFQLAISAGSYYAMINFIGLAEKKIDSIFIKDKIVDLGEIKLKSTTAYLKEIEVRAEKSTLEISLDKRIYNVGKDMANTGGSAIDILDNIPSVTVEMEGGISLRGNGGVQILIDGKPSSLVSNGNTDGLQSLSADMIQKVEVITSPSAKFQAEGTAGIINILLKKENKNGINGASNLSIGHPSLYNVGLNINRKNKRLNVFGNFALSDQINLGEGTAQQEIKLENGSTEIINNNHNYDNGGRNRTLNIGSDLNLNKNTIFNASIFYSNGDQSNGSEIVYENYLNSLDNNIGSSIRTEEELIKTERIEYSASFKQTFGAKKQSINADFSFQDNSRILEADYLEQFNSPDGSPSIHDDLIQKSFSRNEENRLVARLDYTLPIKEKNKFEAGFHSSTKQINNDYYLEEFLNQDWNTSEDFSNILQYDESVYGAYLMYGNTVNNLSFQAGIRSEYSAINTTLIQGNISNKREYLNYFPSLHLSYDFSEKNALQLSYSRRIKRPRSNYLNPFVSLDDNRALYSGNPDLNPEFTDVYEIGYVKNWEKGTLGSFIFYRHTTDVIEGIISEIELTEGVPLFFRQPENLNSKDDIGFEFNLSYTPNEWWKINGDIFVYRAIIDGKNIDEEIVSKTNTGRARLTSKISLSESIDLQFRLNYIAPKNIQQGTRKSVSFLNISAAKKILKEKGKLTVNISDVFNSRRVRGTFITENIFRENDYRWRSRTIRLSFNYRFKK